MRYYYLHVLVHVILVSMLLALTEKTHFPAGIRIHIHTHIHVHIHTHIQYQQHRIDDSSACFRIHFFSSVFHRIHDFDYMISMISLYVIKSFDRFASYMFFFPSVFHRIHDFDYMS